MLYARLENTLIQRINLACFNAASGNAIRATSQEKELSMDP